MEKSRRDYCGGALMCLLGVGAMAHGSGYKVGSLTQMGPGFFPVVLGAILSLNGAALLIAARMSAVESEEAKPPLEWKAWAYILIAIAAFVVLGKYGGLIPATLAVVFVSSLADRKNTLKSALILSMLMVLLAVVVFRWALQLQFPLFTWG